MKNIFYAMTIAFAYAVNADALTNCIDLSGNYRFEENCEETTYNADALFLPQPSKNASHGIHLGSEVSISQKKCDSLTLNYYVVSDKPYLMTATFDRTKRNSDTNEFIRFSSKAIKFGSHKVNLGALNRFRFDWNLSQDSNEDIQVIYDGSSTYFPFGTIHIKHRCKLTRIP